MKDLILNILWIEGYYWYYLGFILTCYGILFLTLFLAEKKRSTVVFSWMILSAVMWIAAMFAEDTFVDRGNADMLLIFTRLTGVGPVLLSMFAMWYAYLVAYGEKMVFSPIKKILIFAVPLALAALSPTSFHVKSVAIENGVETWEPGPLYYVFFIYAIIYMLIWFPSVIVSKLRRTDNALEKKYLRALLTGFMIYTVGILTFSVVLPTFFDIDSTAISPFATLPLLIAILYSILKGSLFNVKLVSAEIFSVVISIVMFINLYNAKNVPEVVVGVIILIATLVFSVFFIRSVVQEVKSREQIQLLADDLAIVNGELTKWNAELERRVDEQTVDVRRAYDVEKKAHKELERLDKAKTQFILNTQHHLRTPLTIVKGGAAMLAEKKENTELSDADRLYAKKALEAATRLGQLLDDFLAITSIKVSEKDMQKTFSAFSVIEEVIAKYAALADQKGVSISVEARDGAKEASFHGEKEQILTAFSNVLDNAIRYTRPGGNVLIISSVKKENGKGLYIFDVTDAGIGMTADEIEKAYNPFERSKRAEELYATGRGIGLVLTRSIVEAYGGALCVSSDGEEKGTRAKIELPLV